MLLDQFITEEFSNEMIKELSETYTGQEKHTFIETMVSLRSNLINATKKADDNNERINFELPEPETPITTIPEITTTIETFLEEIKRLENEYMHAYEVDRTNEDEQVKINIALLKWKNYSRNLHKYGQIENDNAALINFVKKDQAETYIKEQVLAKAESIKPTVEAIRYLIREKYRFKSHLNAFYTEQEYTPEFDQSGETLNPLTLIEGKIKELTEHRAKTGKKVKFNLNTKTLVTLFSDLWDNDIIDQQQGMSKTAFNEWVRENFIPIDETEITESYATQIFKPDPKNVNNNKASKEKRLNLTPLIEARKEEKAKIK